MFCTTRAKYKRTLVWLICLTTAVTGSTFANGFDDVLPGQFQRPDTIPFPVNNPYSIDKATLGKMQFFDTRLSLDQNISSASCHNPSFSWEVPFARAIGVGGQRLCRHSPITLNLVWTDALFFHLWRYRAPQPVTRHA